MIGQDAYGFPVSDLYRVKDAFMSRVDLVNTMGVVMALPDARELFAMPDEAHQLLVHGYDHEDADRLAEAVRGLPAASGLEVLSWREAMPELANMLDLKGVVDVIFVAIVFVAAAAGIANTAIMSTYERTHEFGMLLAVGARPRRVLGMVLVESIVLGLIGVALGSALGVAVVLVTNRTGINYAALGGVEADAIGFAGISFSYVIHPILEARHVVFGVVAVTLTSVLASMWPAASAARLEPVEAMRA